jgi:hypothetical protein
MRWRVAPSRWLSHTAAVAVALLAATATAAAAQQQDTVRGRVLSSANVPLAEARIVLMVQGDSADRTVVRADSAGRFRIVRASAPRGYLVTARYVGFTPRVDTLTRANADQHTLVADFRLVPVAATLEAVKVVGKRPHPMRQGLTQSTPGAVTDPLYLGDGANGDPAGGLAAALANIPGLTVIPDPAGGIPSFSAFGLSSDQNSVTLNGLNFFGAALPRDGLRAQVVSSTYDPGKGGAGAQVELQLPQGGNGAVRTVHGTLEAPWLQWPPSGTPGIDNRSQQFIVSGRALGPIRTNRVFYSASGQLRGRSRSVTPLDVVGPGLLRAADIAPDSASRLLDMAQARGFPRQGAGGLSDNSTLSGTVMFRADYLPPLPPGGSLRLSSDYSLLVYANGGRGTGLGASPFALASSASHTTSGSAFVQAGASLYPGPFLNETYLTAGVNHSSNAPDLLAPGAIVRVGADSVATAADAAAPLRLGGGGIPVTTNDHRAVQLRNQTSWYSVNGDHFFQITLDAMADQTSLSRREGPGTFTFESLSDFSSDQPSLFQRTIANGARRANGFSGALGIGSIYSPHSAKSPRSRFQLQYGLRAEYNRVTSALERDPVAASALGVRTDVEPSTLTIAPMAGFSAAAGEFVMPGGSSTPRFHFSGGVREYTAPLASGRFAGALGTGDPLQILCVGSAAPVPDWSGYFAATIQPPTQCLSGAPSALSGQAHRLLAYAPDYTAARSWRAQFTTSTQITPVMTATVGATATLNRRQPEPVERNFAGVARFALANEANRPIFVGADGIDATSGRVSPSTSRLTDQLGPVTQVTSTGENKGVQLTASLSFRPIRNGVSGESYQLSYAFKDYRARSTGFSGTTAGDPRAQQWSTTFDPAHTLVASARFFVAGLMTIQTTATFTSGARFTPMVGSDINGDGYANDRAFVFDPLRAPSAGTRDAMAALLRHAPHWAASCLEAQRGRIAGANSCTGPWTSTLNAVVGLDPYRLGFGNRGSIQFKFTNLLAGAAALFHGANRQHGWGQPAFPDYSLLTVRGFDPATRTFQYDVNPYFGSSKSARLGYRAPFSVAVDVRLDVGPNKESSYLEYLLRPAPGDSLLTGPEIRRRITRRSYNLYDLIARRRDSLGLDTAQVAAISKMAARYDAFRDAVYDDLVDFLVSRNGEFGGADVRERWHTAVHRVHRESIVDAPALRQLLTAEQYLRIPPTWRYLLEKTARQMDREDREPWTSGLP